MTDDDQFRTEDGTQGGKPWDVQNPDPWDGGNGPRPGGRSWFGPKTFGYGLQPRSWQGWLITAGIAAIAVVIGLTTKGHGHHSGSVWVIIPIAAVLLVRVVFMMQRRR